MLLQFTIQPHLATNKLSLMPTAFQPSKMPQKHLSLDLKNRSKRTKTIQKTSRSVLGPSKLNAALNATYFINDVLALIIIRIIFHATHPLSQHYKNYCHR